MSARSPRRITALMRNHLTPTQLHVRSRPTVFQLPRVRARMSSTRTPNEPRETGSINQKTFYKTFGRPIAKVFLMAIFTYQLAYYLWVRLEQDETRAEMQATISDLEARIDALEQAKTQKKR
ncbi:hypothetical protein F5Y03DRAFT_390533 [Xylaria venustula]|nr:hypothetical protein F5Y03DRAFT_390533 [Xylaria venustula]